MNDPSTCMPTKAMILAAGRGTRLGELGLRTPKCMMPIGGKPVMEHTVERMARFGLREIVINLCHLPEAIERHFGDGSRWGVRIRYSREETPLGTAGGVRNAADFFDGPFFVWYGDNLSSCDLGRMAAYHREKGGVATIALHHHPNPRAAGIVGLDEDGMIVRFLEKPRPEEVFSDWANSAIYLLEPEVLEAIPAEGTPDFGHDVFPALLARGERLYGYRLEGEEGLWWIDTPEDLRRVQGLMAQGIGVGG